MTEKEKFEAYEEVRASGITNMFDTTAVSALSGLDREDILWVMKHYPELREKYSKEKED